MPTAARRFLMCRPEHFGVDYAINPWMDPASWARDGATLVQSARREWTALNRTLARLGADIELVPPAPRLPDLVFTANAAVVLDRKAVLARFRYPERRGEEVHFEASFRRLQARGVIDAVIKLPGDLVLEGAGDCVWDDARQAFWMGYGPRSDRAAATAIEDFFGVEAVPLKLADPRFYHLDTALCCLTRGEVMFAPGAFTPEALAAVKERVAPADRIEVDSEDAGRLAANAVCVGDVVVMSGCGDRLRTKLASRGYRVVTTAQPFASRCGSTGDRAPASYATAPRWRDRDGRFHERMRLMLVRSHASFGLMRSAAS
jgi:N-dimethylarginine dimethylaminohydrolase